jgi:hypothetical protein
MKRITFGLILTAVAAAAPDTTTYQQAISQTASMVSNAECQKLAQGHGLNILNLTWEDTGRYKGSAVGPNISDLTLQVQSKDQVTCMPVIRFPNFEDKSADLALENFQLLVGNERGKDLKKVNLREYLGNFRSYLHDSKSWKGDRKSLLPRKPAGVVADFGDVGARHS